MKLYTKTATELSELLITKQVSSKEVINAFISRAEQVEPEVDSFITTTFTSAKEQAEAIDKKRQKGEALHPLAGVPFVAKDNILTEGVTTTCASKILENFVPPYSATVIKRAEGAGLILLGKTNMDEFAMGSTTETSYFKNTKNPWDTSKVPGGSSGGSASSVSAGQAPFSLGSDTGGSIRLPATFCGVYGLKPTYGTVSRYGVTAFASSLDQVGPIGRSASDIALLYDVIKGHDMYDAVSANKELEPSNALFGKGVKGLTIGVPKEYFTEKITAEVSDKIGEVIRTYEKEGAIVKEVSLPSTQYALATYYIISSAEASSNLGRFDGTRFGFRAENVKTVEDLYKLSRSQGFGDEVQRRIMFGTHMLSEENYNNFYKRAMMVKKQITAEFEQVFNQCDILITPTAPGTAFSLGEKDADLLEIYQGDNCTITANLAGIPAVSMPVGFDSKGLPLGLQLMGPKFSEPTLLATAHHYETLMGGFNHIPNFKGGA